LREENANRGQAGGCGANETTGLHAIPFVAEAEQQTNLIAHPALGATPGLGLNH
jgi:hypothetical protein